MPNITETTLIIDLNALEHNFRHITARLSPSTKIMGVVKAFAYGSDSVVIAKKLEQLKVDYLAVAYASEGVRLRENGIKAPILVLHPQTTNFNDIVTRCLEPNLYSPLMLERFVAFAKDKQLQNYPIHIKINTGMNRLGFSPNELDSVAQQIKDSDTVMVKSVFSHLAASDDSANRAFAEQQIADFKKSSDALIEKLDYVPLRHTLNTSGILNFPDAQFDMVRTGIGLYGFGNEAKYDKELQPIATLKTIVSQIHSIKKGEFVGYNFGFKAERDMTTATLPLGHADGIARIYGKGTGFVFINGQKAPMIGNICMDMLMVDITGIDCREGDEVIVFDKVHPAEDLAGAANTISYELITSVSQRVKRIVIDS